MQINFTCVMLTEKLFSVHNSTNLMVKDLHEYYRENLIT
jgi:hypothetical protein